MAFLLLHSLPVRDRIDKGFHLAFLVFYCPDNLLRTSQFFFCLSQLCQDSFTVIKDFQKWHSFRNYDITIFLQFKISIRKSFLDRQRAITNIAAVSFHISVSILFDNSKEAYEDDPLFIIGRGISTGARSSNDGL